MTGPELAFAGAAFLETDAGRLLAHGDAPEPLSEILRLSPELEPEYVRLFLNPAGAPCPPWQSAYEAEHRLMGEAHTSARKWYWQFGAEPEAGKEPADHVGLLLIFYAQLMMSGAGTEERRRFFRRHLYWIPSFAASVAAESRSAFYQTLGKWLSQALCEPD